MTEPHPYDEDPEDYIGGEIPDPWWDPEQDDFQMSKAVNTDGSAGPAADELP